VHFSVGAYAIAAYQSLGVDGCGFCCACMRCNCSFHLRLYLLCMLGTTWLSVTVVVVLLLTMAVPG
jgi:hypothetical protein